MMTTIHHYRQSFISWYLRVRSWCQHHSLVFWSSVWLVVGGLLVVMSRFQAFQYVFNDETDHIAVGYFVFRYGQRLYRDIITIHQPLPVIIGGVFSLLARRANIYTFVSDMRLLMCLYWLLTGWLLTWRFRGRGFLVSAAGFILQPAYFGLFVLAEALVWPAVAFLLLTLGEKLIHKKTSVYWPEWLADLVWGVSCGYLIFNLLPMAPFIIVATLAYWWPARHKKRQLFSKITRVMAGWLLVAIGWSFWISPAAWWQQTVVNFWHYWSDDISLKPLTLVAGYLTQLFYPFLSALWAWPRLDFLCLSLLIVYPLYYCWCRKRPVFWQLVFGYWLVTLLNNRVNIPDKSLWEGFHLLPFMIGLLVWLVMAWNLLWSQIDNHYQIAAVIITVVWLWGVGGWLRQPAKRQETYEINYLPQQSLVNVIESLKKPDDRLLTGEEGYGYLNLLTDLPFADEQNFHLAWSWRVPSLKYSFYQTMSEKPPAFIYFPKLTGHGFPDTLRHQWLPASYQVVVNPGGTGSGLFVHQSRVNELSDEQMRRLEALQYSLATVSADLLD